MSSSRILFNFSEETLFERSTENPDFPSVFRLYPFEKKSNFAAISSNIALIIACRILMHKFFFRPSFSFKI